MLLRASSKPWGSEPQFPRQSCLCLGQQRALLPSKPEMLQTNPSPLIRRPIR